MRKFFFVIDVTKLLIEIFITVVVHFHHAIGRAKCIGKVIPQGMVPDLYFPTGKILSIKQG